MLNEISIMGRLTSDPKLRRTGSGTAVASFSVACERDFAQKDGKREADFIECVAWRHAGEFVSKYFCKGDMICVTGRLEVRPWEDKDGNKRRTTEINVAHIYFCGSKKQADGGTPAATYKAPAPVNDYAVMEDDDAMLPF